MIDLETGSSDESSSYEYKKKEELDFRVWFMREMRSHTTKLEYKADSMIDSQNNDAFNKLRDGVL